MIASDRSVNIHQRTSTLLLIKHRHQQDHSVLVIPKQLSTILPNIVVLIPAMIVGALAGLLLMSVLLGVSLYEGIGLRLKNCTRRR
jgi:hypothetical protein